MHFSEENRHMEKNNYVCMYMYVHMRMYSTSKEGGANFCHNFFAG